MEANNAAAMREALADIVAEMRNRATTIINGRAITERNFVTQQAVEDWADRIEAAAKREVRDAEYPPGQSVYSDKLRGRTIKDIVQNLRDIAKAEAAECAKTGGRWGNPGLWHYQVMQFAAVMADRVEAAWKRERIKRDKVSFRCGDCAEFGGDCDAGDVDGNEDCIACAKFRRRSAPGNAAAMREALEHCMDTMCAMCSNTRNCEMWDKYPDSVGEGFGRCEEFLAARAALAVPERNCDVGTAEEQSIRFDDFCHARKPQGCRNCPCYQPEEVDCQLVWAQMPYEAKEEDSNG